MQDINRTALGGIKVLDLSRILAGPWATQMLADFGADVIKIEHPRQGDDTRGWGPPFLGEKQTAAYFHAANRGKRSLALDISSESGQQIVRQLATGADVLVENFKVDGLAKYGLDFTSLKALNPKLIYCSITGFGQNGPYAHRAGYDFMIQAMGGLMSITGEADGSPVKVGVALADVLTGLYACNAIQAALLYRQQSGRGQHIDLSLLDVQVASLANQAMNYLATGLSPLRQGNSHPNIVPYQSFATADGYIILAIGNDSQFARFCKLLGREEWSTDDRFTTNQARVRNRAELVGYIQPLLLQQDSQYWLDALEASSIPGGPINDLKQVFSDPQIRYRQMQRHFSQGEGSVPFVANPIRFSESSIQYGAAPPKLGEHSDSILHDELGLSCQQLDELRRNGVLR
ncbi:CaiB/BaiF CoA transferase family protein [Bowmanella dokdonensis]|uniref:CoA transferase n=1 Tax=Bowmanella dokdonensis TaxID=751969 RepID=A0A939DR54_9ALTE|nr:CaiB/BaiF CoA-transferase family protein [Bowmanella dokdonensis]MBN7827479.1 CoA transferase [Bowmanella dokdonensis]